AQEVIRDLQDFLDRSRTTNAPWSKARIFGTRIRRNIKLAECPSFGQSIFAYAPTSNGAVDYSSLAREVLGEGERPVGSARLEIAMTEPDGLHEAVVMERQTSLEPTN